MSKGCLSIFWCLLQLISLMLCNFCYRDLLTLLVRLISRYLVFFGAIANAIVFLVSFLGVSLLSWQFHSGFFLSSFIAVSLLGSFIAISNQWHRKAIGCYMLIFYPATLLHLFISSKGLLVEF